MTRAAVALLTLTLLAGCVFRTVREQHALIDSYCTIAGTVTSEHTGAKALVVVLWRRGPAGDAIADHYVLEKPGRWIFRVTPGRYRVAAFADLNGNLHYEPTEPALSPADNADIVLASGARRDDVALAIPAAGRLATAAVLDIAGLQARSIPDQANASLGTMVVEGEVLPLSDARFDPEHATTGLWAPLEFIVTVHPGIYFLEAYDPKKIPVLFVHGITGTPRDFAGLVAHLDRKRFQPWFFYYPGGGHLDEVGLILTKLVTSLRVRYQIPQIAVVAHSMGGLVARGFVLRMTDADPTAIPLFVSISSPWNGHWGAELGVQQAPAVVRSWEDMAPGSKFLDGIFYTGPRALHVRRRLPATVAYHLLFGFRRSGMRSESSDGTIDLSSQLRQEAQEEAVQIRGFDATHMGILADADASALLNGILGRWIEPGTGGHP